MTGKEFERAYLAGYTAKQNGAKPETNPYIRKPGATLLRDQRHRGFTDAAEKMKAVA